MRMLRIVSAIVLCCWLQQANAQFLRAQNGKIVNEKGEAIIWRGMGLGGWMLQEGYMYHLHFLGQQYRIREKIADLLGRDTTNMFYAQWLQNHCSRRDIDSLAAWGFNSIRLPMHYNLYTLPVDQEPVAGKHTWLEQGFALTDSLLSWCKANQMYLILDLHATPGGQGNDLAISDRDPKKPSLWQSRPNQEKTIALWEKLAERYANEPWIGGYDIINEPNWGFQDPEKDFRGTAETKNEPLRKLMIEITEAIRRVDKRHIIIIEGNGFGNNYRGVLPPWDDNLVMSFHKYGNFNTTGAIQNFLDLRKQYGIPLWLGESGENSNTWFTEAIRLVEGEGIGWAWWQMKKMGINNPLEIIQPQHYDSLLNYWRATGPRPSRQTAWTVLSSLLENLKIENNRFHPDVVDAMMRQTKEGGTKPFAHHVVKSGLEIPTVDFDMGAQRVAYYDRDTARYQYTPGVNTIGNKGGRYRNDGVDIREGAEGPYIFSIEDGEWCQYTVAVADTGRYQISVQVSAEKPGGRIALDLPAAVEKAVPNTGAATKWSTIVLHTTYLREKEFRFRVKMIRGGFNLAHIRFDKVNN